MSEFWVNAEFLSGLVWSASAIVCSLVLLLYVRRANLGLIRVLPLVYAAAFFLEGVAFLISSFRDRDSTTDESTKLYMTAAWMVVECTNGGFAWCAAAFLLRTDLGVPNSSKMVSRMMWFFPLLGLCLGVSGGVLVLLNQDWTGALATLLFFGFFETMQIATLTAALRIRHLTLGKPGQTAALGFLLCHMSLLALHVWQLAFTAQPDWRDQWSLTAKNLGNSAVAPVMFMCLVSEIRAGVFNKTLTEYTPEVPVDPKAPEVAATRQAQNKAMRRWTVFVIPEYWWAISGVPLALGYLGAGLLTGLVTKPDMNHDPIFHMYATYHPCILLDYLPGTLWAQPMFTLSVYCLQACVILSFIRSACGRNLIDTLHLGWVSAWLVLCTCIFELVFTFNPGAVSPLAHSIPFMLNQTSVMFFLMSQTMTVIYSKDPRIRFRHKQHFVMYALVYLAAEGYGMFFMAWKLMHNSGGEHSASDLAVSSDSTQHGTLHDKVPEGRPDFDPVPFVMAILQVINQWAYGVMCPLKLTPLVFELSSSTAKTSPRDPASSSKLEQAPDGADYKAIELSQPNQTSSSEPEPSALNRQASTLQTTTHQNANWFQVDIGVRTFLTAATVLMFSGSFVVVFLDRAVHGDVSTWTWSKLFTTSPGSVVVAVIWVVITLLFGLSAASLCTHEAMTNKSLFMRCLTYVGAVALVLSSLCAHAGTIPNSDTIVPWFDGPAYFMSGLAAWFFINTLLNLQTAKRDWRLLVDLAATTLLIVLLVDSILTPDKEPWDSSLLAGFRSDIAWCLCLGVVSFTDCRGVRINFKNIRQADDADKIIEEERNYPLVPSCFRKLW